MFAAAVLVTLLLLEPLLIWSIDEYIDGSVTQSCDSDTENCYISCTSCTGLTLSCPNNLDCSTCHLQCSDSNACESVTIYGESCQTLNISLLSGDLVGSEMKIHAPNNGGNVIVTSYDTLGDEAFRYGEISGTNGTNSIILNVNEVTGKGNNDEARDVIIYGEDANYVEFNCHEKSVCDDAIVYCPRNTTYATSILNRMPCTINCTDATTCKMTVYIHGKVWQDELDLICPSDKCEILIYCNNRLSNYCFIKDFQTFACDSGSGAQCQGTKSPTTLPTPHPTGPTSEPTKAPTGSPSLPPTSAPTLPTYAPVANPTNAPVLPPTGAPSQPPTNYPSQQPVQPPTHSPSQPPTQHPSEAPSSGPTNAPSQPPTQFPSRVPSQFPTIAPSGDPTQYPSQYPTGSPSLPPTNAPSMYPTRTPSNAPSTAPTNTYCDDTIQTNDTYWMCQIWLSLSFDSYLLSYVLIDNLIKLHEPNFCHVSQLSEYFKCDDNETINQIYWSNLEIESDIASLVSALPTNITVLDISGNNFCGTMGNNENDWSNWYRFEKLTMLKIGKNNLTTQTVIWETFAKMANLEILDLGFNNFVGTIKFDSLTNLKYLDLQHNSFTTMYNFDSISKIENLQEFYVNDNNISTTILLRSLPTNNFTIFHCYNNSISGDLIINVMPRTLIDFNCHTNNFGSLTWTASSYNLLDYKVKYLDLSNCDLNGEINMDLLVDYGEFNELLYLYLYDNPDLTIDIDFSALNNSQLILFDILNVGTSNDANFSDLTSFIKIKMDTSVICDESYCIDSLDGKTESSTRSNDTCIGKIGCENTCMCVKPQSLNVYVDYGVSSLLLTLLIIGICLIFICLFVGFYHSKGMIQIKDPRFKRRDDFSLISCLPYIFQLWDFFSDIFLCYDIWDHYYQTPMDNPQKDDYLNFFVASLTFIFVPWTINLVFLLQEKQKWQKEGMKNGATRLITSSSDITTDINANLTKQNKESMSMADIDEYGSSVSNPVSNLNTTALGEAEIHTARWLTKYGKFLVLLCMLSGGLASSLRVVNCKLFGLDQFNMGLPRYKQDETGRHRVWLTVLIENIPQIFISTLYASTLLGEFGAIVIFALVSSCASVVLTLVSVQLEFPKQYYIYEMKCTLWDKDEKLREKLRQTTHLSLAICDSLDKEFGFVYVENAYAVMGNLSSHGFIANIISNSQIDLTIIDEFVKRQMRSSLKLKTKMDCDDIVVNFVKYEVVELLSIKQVFINIKELIVMVYEQGCNNNEERLGFSNNGDERVVQSGSVSPKSTLTQDGDMPSNIDFANAYSQDDESRNRINNNGIRESQSHVNYNDSNDIAMTNMQM